MLGTAAYMSPEQARGRPVDRRTDIWAFGCVLFEMLTGRRTFESGETLSDAVAAILKSDPDWTAMPANTPPYIRRLLRRCLQKDPRKRLPHIGLARLEIDDGPGDAQGASAPVGATMPRWRRVAGPRRRGHRRWRAWTGSRLVCDAAGAASPIGSVSDCARQ